jgi:23S rRNA (cytidine1920-2'-O)/16S rRNA (cytidine1409-2'-O)-methyltransferase
VTRQRLDQALVDRGLVSSRSRARGLIVRGRVSVGGVVAVKPAVLVDRSSVIQISEDAAAFVSFGADKLVKALDMFGTAFDPKNRIVIDVGASTGGFTDVLLRRGAAKVYAVDVGRAQLHNSLQTDPRVVVLEETDARSLTHAHIPEFATAIVSDVSFISLTKALPAALALAAPGAWLIALIKPQFEAGPDAIGKGGIVRSVADRERAIAIVRAWLSQQPGWRETAFTTWPSVSGDSNEEYLIGAHFDGGSGRDDRAS